MKTLLLALVIIGGWFVYTYGAVGTTVSSTITISAEVAAVPEPAPTPTPTPTPGGGGGGGGGGATLPPSQTVISFSGRAYPLSTVTLLKDAQIVANTVAGSDAQFEITLTGVSPGNYIFSLYGEDSQGRRSSLLTFPLSVTKGTSVKVGGIFVAPTIDLDKNQVKRGDTIAIFGQSAPDSEITILVASNHEIFMKVNSDSVGAYLYNFNTAPLEIGEHFTKSKAAFEAELSPFSSAVGFLVGTTNIPRQPEGDCGRADLNCDERVNLIDFSIAAFWYKRPISSSFRVIEAQRLSGDGKVDLIDFSIMAFYWTG